MLCAGAGAPSSPVTIVEKRFVGGRLRSCALSSLVRTRRRGDPAGGGGDASVIVVFAQG
jgi:hypothetical protein